jgi:hypothetical protein
LQELQASWKFGIVFFYAQNNLPQSQIKEKYFADAQYLSAKWYDYFK